MADTSLQTILMLIGPKRSGKGTIARVLSRLIGLKNIASPTLGSLGLPFGLASLLNKTLAILSDARLSHRTDAAVVVERLLSISGADFQTIDRKHKESLTVKLNVRFMILTNELPKLNDPSRFGRPAHPVANRHYGAGDVVRPGGASRVHQRAIRSFAVLTAGVLIVDWYGFLWQHGQWHRVTGPHASLAACSQALGCIGEARGVPCRHQMMTGGHAPTVRPADDAPSKRSAVRTSRRPVSTSFEDP